jgi:hypothetical protein
LNEFAPPRQLNRSAASLSYEDSRAYSANKLRVCIQPINAVSTSAPREASGNQWTHLFARPQGLTGRGLATFENESIRNGGENILW